MKIKEGSLVGKVAGFKGDTVVVVVSHFVPDVGDLLLVREEGRDLILQVRRHRGGAVGLVYEEVKMSSLASIAQLVIPERVTIEAEMAFAIRYTNRGAYVVKPTKPPTSGATVKVLTSNDPDSDNVMNALSNGISPATSSSIPIAWLRAGIAQSEIEKRTKYFMNHPLRIDIVNAVRKHVLVAGQTGAGKTTSIKGMILHWALKSRQVLSWLIVDRHGEYGQDFMDLVNQAMSVSGLAKDVTTVKYTIVPNRGKGDPTRVSISASSLLIEDMVTVLELGENIASILEEVTGLLVTALKSIPKDATSWAEEFLSIVIKQLTGEGGIPNGQVLALIPLLVTNMLNWEGVGEHKKVGIYGVLKNAGADIIRLRGLRHLILTFLGLRTRQAVLTSEASGNNRLGIIEVIDDSCSAFKVSPILKNPDSVVALMGLLTKSNVIPSSMRTGISRYPWRSRWIELERKRELPIGSVADKGLSVDYIASLVNKGAVVILDVSELPPNQGDAVAISVLRRIFESRLLAGVRESLVKPVIAVVSEEAPLYLGREKVRSRYNIFARVAREGRKFGIGLIAVTQLATDIDEQILANFNTIIALRTKYRADINYYGAIGVPSETLPKLGDREGYLYTPDLRVKEPIPVYFPAPFDLEDVIKREYIRIVKIEDGYMKAFSLAKSVRRWSLE